MAPQDKTDMIDEPNHGSEAERETTEALSDDAAQLPDDEAGPAPSAKGEDAVGENEEGQRFGWFAVHTYSGYEKSVYKTLTYLRETQGLGERLKSVYVPTEQVKIRRADGKEMKRERPLYPGYVFLRMVPDPEVVKIISDAPKVIGFVRAGDDLQPFTDEEMAAIEEGREQRRRTGPSEVPFRVGDRVKIVDGLFAPFSGAVEDVTPEKKRLKVTVGIFGRPIPVELGFEQVELSDDEEE